MRTTLSLVAPAMLLTPVLAQADKPTWRPLPQLSVRGDGFAMAYDHARERIVMFGGWVGVLDFTTSPAPVTYLDNTWEWNGARWLLKRPVHTPPAREGHAMFYCPVRKTIILFGGVEQQYGALRLFKYAMWA